MTLYYDSNFGEYQIESEEDIEFYHQVQRTNVRKRCKGCGEEVMLQPQYAYCNSCANLIERGFDV